MKAKFAMIFAVLQFSSSVSAADLGVMGEVFPVKEKSMLDTINQRLLEMQASGELDRIKSEAQERVKKHVLRPIPVPNLNKAIANREYLYDPTFVVGETITDNTGHVLAKKGDKINPLENMPIAFNKTLFFIDADDAEQIDWIKREKEQHRPFKIILVNGDIKKASELLDERIYFDQNGLLTKKFGFKSLPVLIIPNGNQLRVEEVAVGATN